MNQLLILYASQTGTAQYLAEQLHRILINPSITVRILSIDQYDYLNLPLEQIVYFLISTTGDGANPTSMNKFWQFLLIKDLPPNSLINVRFSVFGLGDSKYQKFNWAARKLRARVLQLGATQIPESAFGDDQHPCGVETEFISWSQKCVEICGLGNQNPQLESMLKLEITTNHEQDQIPRVDMRVIQNIQLTPPDHNKQTLSVVLQSNLTYQPGDVLVIKPQNDDIIVMNMSRVLGYDSPNEIILQLEWVVEHYKQQIPSQLSLYTLLKEYMDLSSPPTRYFIKMLSLFSTNPIHKEKLQEMSSNTPQGLEDYYKYVQREKRNPYEILFDFQPCILPIEWLIQSLNLMRPREYSIATYRSGEVGIMCALVSYRTNFNRIIEGVCSKYLRFLGVDEYVQATITRGTFEFPKNPNIPVIMVGPGTGLAPFLSYLEYRSTQTENTIPSVLFFGSCYRDKEFYHREFLESLVLKNQLRLFTAFSREQQEKVYVQHLILQQKQLIKELIESHIDHIMIFVAGTSRNMPQQVEQAFQDVIGFETIQLLKKRKQYQLECW